MPCPALMNTTVFFNMAILLCSSADPLLFCIRFIEIYDKNVALTLGTLSAVHTWSNESFLRISHAESVGLVRLYCAIEEITSGVRSRGLLPPVALGTQRPVHRYQRKILLTHPLDTCKLHCGFNICWINTYRLSVSEDPCTTHFYIFLTLLQQPRTAWSGY